MMPRLIVAIIILVALWFYEWPLTKRDFKYVRAYYAQENKR